MTEEEGPGGPSAQEPGTPAAQQSTPGDPLEQKIREHAELEAQFKRLAADFENYRRRQNQEREELIKFAASRVLENFLPIVDNFERAMEAAKSDKADKNQVLAGIELIHRQIQDFLGKAGVAIMPAEGQPFDPQLHEAIQQVETHDHPDHTVLNVVQKGYLLNGKVLRHAFVVVGHNPTGQGHQAPAPGDAASHTTESDPGQQKEESHHG